NWALRRTVMCFDLGTGEAVSPPEPSHMKEKSHCDQVFAAVIEGYTAKDFNKSIDKTNVYEVRSASDPIGNLTQNDVSGNGNNTSLFRTVTGHTATTIINGVRPAIIEGPNFFTESAIDQQNDLMHEELHAYTQWDDNEIFDAFKSFGLEHKNPGTQDISN